MKRAVLKPLQGGEFAVWGPPEDGASYIVSCDPSLGRQWSDGADHSSVGVWRRWPGRILEQVAELHVRWPIGRVGQAIACLARAYGGYVDEENRERNCAIVNIERNLMEAARWAMTEDQQFSEEFFFVPREHRSVNGGSVKVFFTNKDQRSQHYILNTLIDYLDRKAIIIRSEPTVNELRLLEKEMDGSVETNGRDRSVMVMMAVVADQELPAVGEVAKEAPKEDECPWGVDRELWNRKNKKRQSCVWLPVN